MGVVTVGGGQERAGIDQQHSVFPEALGQQLLGLGAAPAGPRDPDAGKSQVTAWGRLVEPSRQQQGGQLLDADPAPGRLGRQPARQVFGHLQRQGHDHQFGSTGVVLGPQ